MSISIGSKIRISDDRGVVGGGVVLAIDFVRVTVAQPFTYRHNGVVVERGTRPTGYALATHAIETVAA